MLVIVVADVIMPTAVAARRQRRLMANIMICVGRSITSGYNF